MIQQNEIVQKKVKNKYVTWSLIEIKMRTQQKGTAPNPKRLDFFFSPYDCAD